MNDPRPLRRPSQRPPGPRRAVRHLLPVAVATDHVAAERRAELLALALGFEPSRAREVGLLAYELSAFTLGSEGGTILLSSVDVPGLGVAVVAEDSEPPPLPAADDTAPSSRRTRPRLRLGTLFELASDVRVNTLPDGRRRITAIRWR